MLTVFLTPGLELPGEIGKEQQVQLEVLVLWPEVRPEHLFCFVCLLVLVSRVVLIHKPDPVDATCDVRRQLNVPVCHVPLKSPHSKVEDTYMGQ